MPGNHCFISIQYKIGVKPKNWCKVKSSLKLTLKIGHDKEDHRKDLLDHTANMSQSTI